FMKGCGRYFGRRLGLLDVDDSFLVVNRHNVTTAHCVRVLWCEAVGDIGFVAFSQTRLLVGKGVPVYGTSTRRDRFLKGKAYNSTAIRQQILILSLLQAKVVPPRTLVLSSEILKLVG